MKRPIVLLSFLILLLLGILLSPVVAHAAAPALQAAGGEHPFGLNDTQWYIMGALLFIIPFGIFIVIGRKDKNK